MFGHTHTLIERRPADQKPPRLLRHNSPLFTAFSTSRCVPTLWAQSILFSHSRYAVLLPVVVVPLIQHVSLFSLHPCCISSSHHSLPLFKRLPWTTTRQRIKWRCEIILIAHFNIANLGINAFNQWNYKKKKTSTLYVYDPSYYRKLLLTNYDAVLVFPSDYFLKFQMSERRAPGRGVTTVLHWKIFEKFTLKNGILILFLVF